MRDRKELNTGTDMWLVIGIGVIVQHMHLIPRRAWVQVAEKTVHRPALPALHDHHHAPPLKEGIVKWCTQPYSLDPATFGEHYRHLANHSLNVNSPSYVESTEEDGGRCVRACVRV